MKETKTNATFWDSELGAQLRAEARLERDEYYDKWTKALDELRDQGKALDAYRLYAVLLEKQLEVRTMMDIRNYVEKNYGLRHPYCG